MNLTPSQGPAAYDLVHDNRNLGQAGVVADIDGVGERAFEISGPNTASIHLQRADALVLVTVEIPTAGSSPEGQVLVLAKTAAGRI